MAAHRSPYMEQCRLGCSVRLVPCVCAGGCCMRVALGCVCVWSVYGFTIVCVSSVLCEMCRLM